MGFEDALKQPLHWMRKEPAVFLLGIILWLPGLLLLPLAFSAFPTIQRLMIESGNDVLALLTRHGGELLQALLPLLIALLIVAIVSALVKVFANLALANAVAQLRQGKPLRLTDALSEAKPRWATLVVAALMAVALMLAVVLAIILLALLTLAALTIPILGILVLIVAILIGLAALLISSVAFSAAFLLLPVIVSQRPVGAFDAVREAFSFINRLKIQSVGLWLIVIVVQSVLGQLIVAALPHLWLVLILSMLVELLTFTWANLFAAEFWFQYARSEAKPKNESASMPPSETKEKAEPGKPAVTTSAAKAKATMEEKPVRRTLKVSIAPKKK